MVINDLNINGAPVFPTEADPPPFVDPYAVLTPAAALQGFQPVAGWGRQVLKNTRAMKVQQLPPRRPLKRLESCHRQIVKQIPGFLVFERLDHEFSVLLIASYVKRNIHGV
jgi:hypothetical protein